jgi:hypothetical protein
LRKAVDERHVRLILTTGDNIYSAKKFLGIPIGTTGAEDDDHPSAPVPAITARAAWNDWSRCFADPA